MVEYLWGSKAKARYLVITGVLLLFVMLGARELWTMESRWRFWSNNRCLHVEHRVDI